MTPEFKARWIADLRKYPKTVGYLKSDGAYCCLGVACLTLGAKFEDRLTAGSHDERPILNGCNLADRGGLTDSTLRDMGLTVRDQTKLIDLNDCSSTFEPVIRWIEENL
jgi:hypothetical protein